MPLPRFATAIVASLFLSCLAVAQRLDVPGPTLQQGELIDVTYTDASRAGQRIKIVIDNLDPLNPQSEKIEIELDETGRGTVQWRVPKWHVARFEGPGGTEEVRGVL